MRYRQSSLLVTSNLAGDRLERNPSTAVFRIFQECLTNTSRYAEASHVEVRLERAGDVLHFEVRDDGRGISAEATSSVKSLGLLGIRERARSLGGSATIGAASPKGTVVAVDLPLAREAAA